MQKNKIELTAASSVSLVVVNYNAGSLLADCLAPALDQVREVIVVDNASTDKSIAQLKNRFPDNPGLRVICNDRNLGFAAACNIGVAVAESPYILFLNPDCMLAPDAVSQLLNELETNPDAGMAGGLLVNPDGSEQGGGRRAVPTPWRSFVRAFGLYRFADRWPRLFFDFYLHKQPMPARPIEVEAISGACMLVKREAMEDVGPLDEGYFLHCEDLDWCIRFRQKNRRVMFVPGARMTHFLGTCSKNCLTFAEWHKHKGMIRFYRKFFRHQYPGCLMGLITIGVWLHFGLVAGRGVLSWIKAKATRRKLELEIGN